MYHPLCCFLALLIPFLVCLCLSGTFLCPSRHLSISICLFVVCFLLGSRLACPSLGAYHPCPRDLCRHPPFLLVLLDFVLATFLWFASPLTDSVIPHRVLPSSDFGIGRKGSPIVFRLCFRPVSHFLFCFRATRWSLTRPNHQGDASITIALVLRRTGTCQPTPL